MNEALSVRGNISFQLKISETHQDPILLDLSTQPSCLMETRNRSRFCLNACQTMVESVACRWIARLQGNGRVLVRSVHIRSLPTFFVAFSSLVLVLAPTLLAACSFRVAACSLDLTPLSFTTLPFSMWRICTSSQRMVMHHEERAKATHIGEIPVFGLAACVAVDVHRQGTPSSGCLVDAEGRGTCSRMPTVEIVEGLW
jgi:hypothetical protein